MFKKLALILSVVLLLQVFMPVFTASAEAATSDTIILFSGDRTFQTGEGEDFEFTLPADSRYFLEIEYKTVNEGKAVTPQIGITINDNKELILDAPHIWTYILDEKGRFFEDEGGNESIPDQKIIDEKQSMRLLVPDSKGASENGYDFSKGANIIRFNMIRRSIIVYELRLVPITKLPTYEEYKASVGNAAYNVGRPITREAEIVYQKSHPEISVTYDRSSPSITPNDPVAIKYNVIGGSGYATPGQWLSWEFDIEESGFYNIDFKYRQNLAQGQIVRRQMFVDGKVLFNDLNQLKFEASEGFSIKTVTQANGEAAPIYFEKGKHTITLKVILGDVAEPLEEIQKIIRELNELYTRIVVIVGEAPDSYRDYDLGDHIPGLLDILSNNADRVERLITHFDSGEDKRNSYSAQLEQVVNTLRKLSQSERNVPVAQDNLRAQVNTLSNLVSSLTKQPLELDTVTVRPTNVEVNSQKASFWEVLKFRFKAFFNSFIGDYNTIGGTSGGKGSLDVWISTNSQETVGFAIGRDQAQVVQQLSREFTKQHGVSVNFSLMSSGVILQAFASGKGPDLSLFVPTTTLANLYFRNAVVDLAATWPEAGSLREDWPSFEEVKARTYESAFATLSYKDKVYALPEVQCYEMVFYRTDIFESLGLTVPNTWDEFYDVMTKLQKAGMQVGVPTDMSIYEAFMLQNGATIYSDDLTSTNLVTDASFEAFEKHTDLFNKQGVPLTISPLNRFRTGQIPMLIQPATFFNSLTVGAIEINNLWSMIPLPGEYVYDAQGNQVFDENGMPEVNRASACKVSSAMMLTSCEEGEKRNLGYTFLEWWTSNETQEKFAFQCEIRFGVEARYFPANIHTLDTMSWGAAELESLTTQRLQAVGVPMSPATYYIGRCFNNAFRKVVYDFENPRDVIVRYGREANVELLRKLSELGLIQ